MSIHLIQGDITKMEVDTIVNAANSGLRGGGGVDGAIHRAGGPEIMEECRKIGHYTTGKAVITTGGNLTAKKVIHTVGPVWNGGNTNEEELLQSAYESSLELAKQHQLKSVAFPNISTGVYGFPKEKAAAIAIEVIQNYTRENPEMDIYFVCFDEENYSIYRKSLNA